MNPEEASPATGWQLKKEAIRKLEQLESDKGPLAILSIRITLLRKEDRIHGDDQDEELRLSGTADALIGDLQRFSSTLNARIKDIEIE